MASDVSSVMQSLLTTVATNNPTLVIDADLVQLASDSIGQTVGALRQATDPHQCKLCKRRSGTVVAGIESAGEAFKAGDTDIESLKDGLRAKYKDPAQIEKVKSGQQAALNSKNNAIEGVEIEADVRPSGTG